MDPTKRRVFAGETVPASEKVVSLFEPHTDIICKGGRATHYGHKINLKRCFGLDRCHWRGWERFQAYVHSAVFAPQPDAADSLTAILTPVSVAASARSSLPYSVGRLLEARGFEEVRAIMGTHQYVKR